MRNTAIRGIQIRDGEIGLTQLSASVGISLGLADSAVQGTPWTGMGYYIGDGSAFATSAQGSLADSALQSASFVDLTDGAGSFSGHALQAVRVNSGATELEYYTPTDVGIVAGDIAVEIVTPLSAEKAYTLDTLAIESSVQVYLNGLLQEEGAGLDYVYSEAGGKSVITFDDFVETDDIIVVHSITVQA